MLAAQGAEVHLVLPGSEAGSALPVTNRHMLMARLYALPIRWHLLSTLKSVDDNGNACIETKGDGEQVVPGPFDCVVYGTARAANTDVLEALEAKLTGRIVCAGECVAPRSAYMAIREGYDAADRLALMLQR